MTTDEVKQYFGNSYQFRKKTNMSDATFRNWMKWGYVPENAQYKLERLTDGKLKVGGVFKRENIEVKVKWPLVVTEFNKIYFNYIDLGNYTLFRMCIFKVTSPKLGLYVSIEDKGSYFFNTSQALHKDYVGEKLFLHGDRGQIADFLNAQLEKQYVQQGRYYECVIRDVEPHGKMGETLLMPWHAELLNER